VQSRNNEVEIPNLPADFLSNKVGTCADNGELEEAHPWTAAESVVICVVCEWMLSPRVLGVKVWSARKGR
jgi:hypothetical protein